MPPTLINLSLLVASLISHSSLLSCINMPLHRHRASSSICVLINMHPHEYHRSSSCLSTITMSFHRQCSLPKSLFIDLSLHYRTSSTMFIIISLHYHTYSPMFITFPLRCPTSAPLTLNQAFATNFDLLQEMPARCHAQAQSSLSPSLGSLFSDTLFCNQMLTFLNRGGNRGCVKETGYSCNKGGGHRATDTIRSGWG